jgi:hypothetical protein
LLAHQHERIEGLIVIEGCASRVEGVRQAVRHDWPHGRKLSEVVRRPG